MQLLVAAQNEINQIVADVVVGFDWHEFFFAAISDLDAEHAFAWHARRIPLHWKCTAFLYLIWAAACSLLRCKTVRRFCIGGGWAAPAPLRPANCVEMDHEKRAPSLLAGMPCKLFSTAYLECFFKLRIERLLDAGNVTLDIISGVR